MGFRFLRKLSSTATGHNTSTGTTSHHRNESFSSEEENRSPHQRRGRSLSVRRRSSISSSTKQKSHHNQKSRWSVFPVTPANHVIHTSRATPTTAPETIRATKESHHHDRQDDNDGGGGVEMVYRDSVLAEQERIRQQLFYEEEGVEVTAEFKRRSSSRPHSIRTSPVATPRRSPSLPQSTTPSSSSTLARTPTSSSSKKKKRSSSSKRSSKKDSPPLPDTPTLDDEESDPVKYFPAIQAAQAKAKAAAETKAKEAAEAKTIKRQPSVASASLQSSSASTKKIATTNTKKKKKNNKPKTRAAPSPVPFDEDPTIMELEKAFSKDVTEYTMDEEDDDDDDDDDDLVDDDEVDLFDEELNHGCGVTTTPNGTTVVSCNPAAAGCGNPALPTTNEDVSRQLLEAFNCGDDFTEFSGSAVHHAKQRSCRLVDAFYDNTCGNYRDAVHMKRPYYDERFAQRFIKDIMEEGLNVLWHLPPSDEDSTLDSANWSGRSVVMTVKAGSSYSTNSNDVMPKLCWTTLGGGKDESKLARCLVPLLKIQSVSTFRDAPPVVGSLGDEIKEEELTGTSCGVNLKPVTVDEEDVCLFAITTEEGDVQVFEAASSRERDVFVTGLKNVIARLSFHVIVGDAGASSELYYQHDKQSPEGQLPSIPSSPAQNMNRIAHALLD